MKYIINAILFIIVLLTVVPAILCLIALYGLKMID